MKVVVISASPRKTGKTQVFMEYVTKYITFLNTKKRGRKSRNTTTEARNSKNTTPKTTEEKDTGVRQRTRRRSGRTGGGQWQAQIEQFQKASPEERQKIIQEFRNRMGNRRRRGD